jgi:lipoic acid synthetase
MSRLPHWVKVKLPGQGEYYDIRRRVGSLRLNTVCEEARCPNIAECWGGGTATFMILGDVCTRGCRFCDVTSGKPLAPDPEEPQNVAAAVAEMKLSYVVITSVDRDDLPDQGSEHFVRVVGALKEAHPELTIELLTPDFRGDETAIERVGKSSADVLGHNLETTRALTRKVRDRRCDYQTSLEVLAHYRALGQQHLVKSSLMLGLGEELDDVRQAMHDLRAIGVDWITFGQYLRPSRKHIEVARYLDPSEFDALAAEAKELGFPLVSAGPLVRSSYRAAEQGAKELLTKRRTGSSSRRSAGHPS